MSRYVEVIWCLLLGVAIIALTSGIFDSKPKFEKWDQPCYDSRKVMVNQVIRGLRSNTYEVYDNGHRFVVEESLLVECE